VQHLLPTRCRVLSESTTTRLRELVCRQAEHSTAQQTSAECLSAVEGTFGCVNNLSSCDEVASWWNEEPADSYSCKSNDDAVNAACF